MGIVGNAVNAERQWRPHQPAGGQFDAGTLTNPQSSGFYPQTKRTVICMSTKTLNEQELINEAMTVLLDHMEPAKVPKFLAARPILNRDYMKLREQLFAGETVDSLADKIRAFE